MFKSLTITLFSLFMVSCADGPNKHSNNKVAINDFKIAYPVDSLLHFDSEKELKKVFGDNLERGKWRSPESEEEANISFLFPETENQVHFICQDDTLNYNKLVFIKLNGKHTDWKAKERITLGDNISQLESLNKKLLYFKVSIMIIPGKSHGLEAIWKIVKFMEVWTILKIPCRLS